MRSLLVKLMVGFALVILLGIIINSLLVSRITHLRFSQYINQSGKVWAENLAPALVEYYTKQGSWEGVDTMLQNPWLLTSFSDQPADVATAENMMGQMHGTGQGQRRMGQKFGGNMLGLMGIHLILADDKGIIIADSLSSPTGKTLSEADIASGTPLLANDNNRIGTLLALSNTGDITTPSGDFLNAINRSTWMAGLAAGLFALIVGLLLFRQIVAPVQAVTQAAQKIAVGDLNQRVPVTSKDEVGQLASAFNQMADALAQDRQLRQNMIVDIAHELRTPLSVLQGNLEAMLDGVLPTSPQEIASLRDETALLVRLVTDLRLLSLAEAGQLKLERSKISVQELINKAVENLHLQAEQNGITLTADIEPDLPEMNVDIDRCTQIIRNLVSNAIVFTPSGGVVTVRAFQQNEKSKGSDVMFAVEDTGEGISPEDLSHVFDRFFRADRSRSRISGGSGIGLAIAKQLVEAHQGQIWVESELGKGSVFFFNLGQMSQENS